MADPETPSITDEESALPGDTLTGIIGQANRLLDAQGGAIPRCLNFGWRGVEFKIERKDERKESHHISIAAHLGFLPFSAENSAARKRAQELVRTTASPTGRRLFCIKRDGAVKLRVAYQEENMSSLPDMLKIVSHRIIELSDKLDAVRAVLIN